MTATRREIQRRALDWFDACARKFPWRATRDAYRTLVAEVMLQQTQTSRVAPVYEEFLRRFPTVQTLAAATPSAVIEAWGGLGYNRRAVALHRAAREIVERYDGAVPETVEKLRDLPGIGPYTASAIACFAYDAQLPVVDTNVRRVLSRVALGKDEPGVWTEQLAAEWLPSGHAYRWNQALMDVGATMCRSRPACDRCPFAGSCAFHAAPVAESPRRKQPPFEGSRRQVRGAIVKHLRTSGRASTLATIGRATGVGVDRLRDIVAALERDGLVVLGPAARQGEPGGFVRLPR